MQTEKIQLRSIKLESLNADCLMAVNRCVRYLKQHHQKPLRLQDRDVLVQISRLVRSIDESDLDVLYQEMKDKMILSLKQNRQEETK